MDFMKVLDQTVREIKREVNIKVLKVPEIEQKVLDATSNEPWGPHGSALAEMAQATKKFSECQLVMSTLWTRLGDGGRNWRHVYKALAVIEYLIAHGSERALDDIIEHTFQVSSLTGFEYVEPNGKDMGINVRKKSETIMGLLSDKFKITEVRNKAAANRDKYFGLSSTGITYKSNSSATSLGSSGFQSGDRYGGTGKREGEIFKDNYRDRDNYGGDDSKDSRAKSRGLAAENEGNSVKNGSTSYGRDRDVLPTSASRTSSKLNHSDDNYGAVPSQISDAPDGPDDDFDDFDPRGTSNTGTAAPSVNQVDLFGDFMDSPTTVAPEMSTAHFHSTSDVDLFADATFVSASPNAEAGANVDLFASQPTFPSGSSTVDFFADTDQVSQTEPEPPKTGEIHSDAVDPFAAVPLNSFDGSDTFGAFTSNTDQVSTEPEKNSPKENSQNDPSQKPSLESKPSLKKDTFQVKSGIWADSLSRGLIDLNISAPTKVNLSDIGIVGGLSDALVEKEKVPPPVYMGRAMGTSSGKSGFNSSTGTAIDDDFFSSFSQQQQFGSFK